MSTHIITSLKKYIGYEVRTELAPIPGSIGATTVDSAYTSEGHYIGGPAVAKLLVEDLGIKPEPAPPPPGADDTQPALANAGRGPTCNIGFSETKGAWYGWSHRSLHGFKVGSTIKEGDVGFEPSNKDEFERALVALYGSDFRAAVKTSTGVKIDFFEGDEIQSSFYPYPKVWGRGTWIAETLEDAREMAIHFARDLS